jgi:hypothetical protein
LSFTVAIKVKLARKSQTREKPNIILWCITPPIDKLINLVAQVKWDLILNSLSANVCKSP